MKIEISDDLFNEEELTNTPQRIRKFYDEWKRDSEYNFTVFDNKNNVKEIIGMTFIKYDSLCSHHLLPFSGYAHIAYIPDKLICGASKLARVLLRYAHRPQMQENIPKQVADEIERVVKPKGVMVVMIGEHQCMGCRGVKMPGTKMTTSCIPGVFKRPPQGMNPRQEFFDLIHLASMAR